MHATARVHCQIVVAGSPNIGDSETGSDAIDSSRCNVFLYNTVVTAKSGFERLVYD